MTNSFEIYPRLGEWICLSQTGKEENREIPLLKSLPSNEFRDKFFSVGFSIKAFVIIRLYFQPNERKGGEQRNYHQKNTFFS